MEECLTNLSSTISNPQKSKQNGCFWAFPKISLWFLPKQRTYMYIIIAHADSNITWLPVVKGHVFACWFYCQTGHYFDCVQPTYLNLCMRALKARPLRQLVVKFFTSTSVYLETDTTAMLKQCSYKTIQN